MRRVRVGRGGEGAGGWRNVRWVGAGFGRLKGWRGEGGGGWVGGVLVWHRRTWPPIAPLKMHMEAVAATASLYTHQLHADLSRHALQSSLRLWQPSIFSAHVLHASGHHSSISLLR